MTGTAIFVTGTLADSAKALLSAYEVLESDASDQALSRCEVLMAWPNRIEPGLLSKMSSLRMVQAMSAGVDALDFRDIPPEVKVFSNAGAYTRPVAEHAWGLLLGVAKGVHVRDARVVPRRLEGKTLLVLGCGAIGSEVAKLSRSLGMRTVGVSRSFKESERFDERHDLSGLGEAVEVADAIVIALPLSNLTRGLVTHGVLTRARESVILVNIGRGEIVEEAGLMRWLRERPESRYATDVFWMRDGRESFDTEAWGLQNFAGTRHISGLPLGEGLDGPMVAAAKNVSMFLQTGTASNRIDPVEYRPANL